MTLLRKAAGTAIFVTVAAACVPVLAAGAGKPADNARVAPPGVIFPTSIDPKFAGQKPWLARLHTCSAQYQIDKAKNALSGLTWYKGYYSICNARLKKAPGGGA